MSSSRARALAALGASLARSGALATTAVIVGGVTTLGFITTAFILGARGSRALAQLPSVASSALAWGAGILLAFAAAVHALRRDRDHGVRALVTVRGASTAAYLRARVIGLGVVLAVVVGGGTALVSISSAAVAPATRVAFVAEAGAASIAYALAFALTMAPVALATLGARSRAGGYLWLVAVVVLPEVLQGWIAPMLPRDFSDLGSIPSALGAFRTALLPPEIDYAHLLRASVVLLAVIAIAVAVVRQQIARVDVEAQR
jgi:hypothetical protein